MRSIGCERRMEDPNRQLDPGGPKDPGAEDRRGTGEPPEQRRVTHNMAERRRKDKIKQWISHIAHLLPPVNTAGSDNRPSTLDIMERAAKYISELKSSYEEVLMEKGDPLRSEINKMRSEIVKLTHERDHLAHVIRNEGISLTDDASRWTGTTASNHSDGASTSTVDNSHLALDGNGESQRLSTQQASDNGSQLDPQQQLTQQQALSQLMAQNGAMVMGGQNMLLNPLLSPIGGMSVTNQTAALTPTGSSSTQVTISPLKDGQETEKTGVGGMEGLIQIAMDNAGITLQDTSQHPSPSPAPDLHPDPAVEVARLPGSQLMEGEGHEALQTLASVASNTITASPSVFSSSGLMMTIGNSTPVSTATNTVTVMSSSSVAQNAPIMSAGQLNSQHPSSSQSNMLMSMNLVNSLGGAGLGVMNPTQNSLVLPGTTAPNVIPSNSSGLAPGTILLNQHGNYLMVNETGSLVPYDPTTGMAAAVAGDKITPVVGNGSLTASSNSILPGGGMSMSSNSVVPGVSVLEQQQQALINSGALTLSKGDMSSSALTSLTVSQPQSSILAGMNSQMAGMNSQLGSQMAGVGSQLPGGMNFLGSQLLTQNALQSLTVQPGNQGAGFLGQTLVPPLGLPFPTLMSGNHGSAVNNPSNSQASQPTLPGNPSTTTLNHAAPNFLFPSNQNGGMVTLNPLQSTAQHLPSAFVLPSGHVIPVVSNPQLVGAGQHGGLMTQNPGTNPASSGHLQFPATQQINAGSANAGQVLQMDAGNGANGAQFILGPNGLQMVAPSSGPNALTQQQQIQQILQQQQQQQQQQQNLGLMMQTPSLSLSHSAPLTPHTLVAPATSAFSTTTTKSLSSKTSVSSSKGSSGSAAGSNQRGQGRSQTPSSSRKSQSGKSTSADSHHSSGASTSTSHARVVSTATSSLPHRAIATTGGASVVSTPSVRTGTNTSGSSGSAGGNPVVLMMQHNGQTLSVLVDPQTLQVLNSPPSASTLSTTPSQAPLLSVDTSTASSTTTSTSTTTKKSKKGNSQRAIFPKPKSKSSGKSASKASLASSTTVVTSLTTPVMITTEATSAGVRVQTEGSEEGTGSDAQDILAKATLSIWPMDDMAQPLVCSPTNDNDNPPLLIDDTALDNDEDRRVSTSPRKGVNTTPKTTPVLQSRTKKHDSPRNSSVPSALAEAGLLLQTQQTSLPTNQDSALLLRTSVSTTSVEASLLSENLVSAAALSSNSSLQDVRLSGSAVSHSTLQDTRIISGSTVSHSTFQDVRNACSTTVNAHSSLQDVRLSGFGQEDVNRVGVGVSLAEKTLQQEFQEQHEQLLRHLEHPGMEFSQPLMVATSVSAVAPSMPTLLSPISDVSPALSTAASQQPCLSTALVSPALSTPSSLNAALTTTLISPALPITPSLSTSLPVSLVSPASVTEVATSTVPMVTESSGPKKPKKSKKKKEKEREDLGENDAEITKTLKKLAKTNKKKDMDGLLMVDAAQKRREEIDKKQQQLLMQQQQHEDKQRDRENLSQDQHLLMQLPSSTGQSLHPHPPMASDPLPNHLLHPASQQDAADITRGSDPGFPANRFALSIEEIPEKITFSENELPNLVDQMDKYNLQRDGTSVEDRFNVKPASVNQEAEEGKTDVKNKKATKRSKKSQAEGGDNATKKMSKSSTDLKPQDVNKSVSTDLCKSTPTDLFLFSSGMDNFQLQPHQTTMTDDLTASSRMSIYDFQDDSPPSSIAKPETPKPKNRKNKSKSNTSTPVLSSTMNFNPSSDSAHKFSESLNTPKPCVKSRKTEKKGGSSSVNQIQAVSSQSVTNTLTAGNTLDSLVTTMTTMTSSKSNDSISTTDSVILPMPGFDTLDSPAPLLSPPITTQTPAQTSEGKSQSVELEAAVLDQPSSNSVSLDVSKTMAEIDNLPDISDITTQAPQVDIPILQSSQPPTTTLHHHPNPPVSNNSNNSNVCSQKTPQKDMSTNQAMKPQPPSNQPPPGQQGQVAAPPVNNQSGANALPSQQASPRQPVSQSPAQLSTPVSTPMATPPSAPPMATPPAVLATPPAVLTTPPAVLATPTSAPPLTTPPASQTSAQMRPPTSPAQAGGRPRSTTSHPGSMYLTTSPQAMHPSPSANCISPSSNHSRSSHDGFNSAPNHLTQSPSSSARLTDMSGMLGSQDMPCPNANLFASVVPPKLSHMKSGATTGEDSTNRSQVYPSENLVQNNQHSGMDPRSHQHPHQLPQAPHHPQSGSSGSNMPGMGNMTNMGDISGEGFNFTSISLNITTAPSHTSGQDLGITSSAPFSFSLTSATTTQTTSSVANPACKQATNSFPFYSSQPSSAPLPPQQGQGPSLGMMVPEMSMDNRGNRPTPRQPPSSSASSQNAFHFGGGMMDMGSCSVARGDSGGLGREASRLGHSMEKSPMTNAGFTQHHSASGGGGSGQKIPPSQPTGHAPSQAPPPPQPPQAPPTQASAAAINRSPQMGAPSSKSSSYFPSPHFPSSASLNTPPLRHPPLPTSESGHGMGRSFEQSFGASQASSAQGFDPRTVPYPKDLNQTRPLEHVPTSSSSSRKPSQPQSGNSSKHKQGQGHSPAGSGASHSQSRAMPSQSSAHSSAASQRAAAQPPPPAHQTSGTHPPAPSPSQQSRSTKRKQTSSSSQSKKKQAYSSDIDANLSHNIFDTNQSFPPFFSLQSMSPPPGRNMQPEGPPFLTGNFFGPSSRQLSNSAGKNTGDLGPPYSMFPPSRPQNSIGINFQHSFGMQAMGSNHGAGHMTPHSVAVTPHMSNFTLGNIFSDVAGGAGDSGLNISPIKFPHHTNPILPPQPGMDPNALQHSHQGGSLYHNRSHHAQPHMIPNAMTLNSFLGHNPHGFDTRPMSQGLSGGVGPPPFHGAGHPSSFAMPSALNFSMQEH